jgi:hypothetical protein
MVWLPNVPEQEQQARALDESPTNGYFEIALGASSKFQMDRPSKDFFMSFGHGIHFDAAVQ